MHYQHIGSVNVRTSLTQAIVRKFKTGDLWIYDTVKRGLVLRVRPSGVNSYLVLLGRGKWFTLGRADVMTPEEARLAAQKVLGAVANGKDPIVEKRKQRAATVRTFLSNHYQPWADANRKTGALTVMRVLRAFPEALLDGSLAKVTAWQLEQWRTARRRAGISDSTINRDLDALRGVLTKAVEWGLLDDQPMRTVKRAKIDVIGRLRYLNAAEEARVRQALVDRDERRRDGRRRFNAWRAERGYKTVGDLGVYADHLTPVVLLALNTGLRRGELLALTWGHVDLTAAQLTVQGASAKSGMTRHLPLNSEARDVAHMAGVLDLRDVRLPGPEGGQMFSLKTAWKPIATAAKLRDFTLP